MPIRVGIWQRILRPPLGFSVLFALMVPLAESLTQGTSGAEVYTCGATSSHNYHPGTISRPIAPLTKALQQIFRLGTVPYATQIPQRATSQMNIQ